MGSTGRHLQLGRDDSSTTYTSRMQAAQHRWYIRRRPSRGPRRRRPPPRHAAATQEVALGGLNHLRLSALAPMSFLVAKAPAVPAPAPCCTRLPQPSSAGSRKQCRQQRRSVSAAAGPEPPAGTQGEAAAAARQPAARFCVRDLAPLTESFHSCPTVLQMQWQLTTTPGPTLLSLPSAGLHTATSLGGSQSVGAHAARAFL